MQSIFCFLADLFFLIVYEEIRNYDRNNKHLILIGTLVSFAIDFIIIFLLIYFKVFTY